MFGLLSREIKFPPNAAEINQGSRAFSREGAIREADVSNNKRDEFAEFVSKSTLAM